MSQVVIKQISKKKFKVIVKGKVLSSEEMKQAENKLASLHLWQRMKEKETKQGCNPSTFVGNPAIKALEATICEMVKA